MAELTNEAVESLNKSINTLASKLGGNSIGGTPSDGGSSKGKDSLGEATISSAKDLAKFGSEVFSCGARVSNAFDASTSVIGNFANTVIDGNGTFGKAMSAAGDCCRSQDPFPSRGENDDDNSLGLFKVLLGSSSTSANRPGRFRP